ncbi:MAG: hypothetical protein EAZ65_07490 [Verrucomicrobia bacterium]|nr:MAG: hypothetical protein EAZ84_04300 [Verrucomicrobiota bacterium]TAE87130.1 MAG: hypothetical protein EAZ82_08705 [Verrucomicrobiota bacterium]TAF24934.1 MAG: hypothetical protein EAZ71_08930 [Verrucomicrobiota bacterium]TAF40739.1 MAG: hypothetical protein EAZ65_07490 [Verrucomicrobiota bacterium]
MSLKIPLIVFSFLSLISPALCQQVTLDPSTPLVAGYWSGGEWESAGNADGWTTSSVANTVVAGGVISGNSSSADPVLSRIAIATDSQPDLDLGFNDFVEFRLQLPASYNGNIELFFGVTDAGVASQTGFSANRSVTVPNSVIPRDGAFHTYRIDMGTVPMWRGYLRDIRLDPATVSGTLFSLDYLRVGDTEGDVYQRNTMDQPDAGAYELSSKHARFIWNASRASEFAMNASWARKNLRNFEEAWQIYVKQYGYQEPAESVDPAKRIAYPGKWKVNFLCIYDGFWMGGSVNSFGYMNMHPGGLRADPPGWVVPHELMHVFQMHQGGGFANNAPMGKWWEGHANYGREAWLNRMYKHFDADPAAWTDTALPLIRSTNLFHSHGIHYYHAWPIFQYLDENPDNLPDLGMASGPSSRAFSARLWRESGSGEYLYNTLERLTPETSLKDAIGYFARRQATHDYSNQADTKVALANRDPELTGRQQITDLFRRADDPGWWQPYPASLPMAFAFATHELVPAGSGAGRVVSVNLRGHVNPERQSDWRASLVVVNDSGIERYSSLWSSGTNSVTLAANENKVYLSVAATPGEVVPTLHLDQDQPYVSHPGRERFPYEIQVTGATPKGAGSGSATMLVHSNGGGLKASTATVEAGAYLGPNARVLDYAVVRAGARVEDQAIVSGHAMLRNGAVVRGHARIREYANLEACDVSGNARVGGHVLLFGNATVRDNATVKGVGNLSRADANDYVGGDAVLDGDCINAQTIINGFHFGWEWGGLQDGTIASKTSPAALFARYEFPSNHAYAAKDKYGATDALLVGAPTWVASDATRNGFLTFNGSGQHVLLSRWLGDMRATSITAQVKWAGGAANQALFQLGDGSTTRRLHVTPSNGSGVCELRIVHGADTYSIPANAALPVGTWTRVGVTLDGINAKLYLNGALAGTASCTVRPEDLMPADTNETPAYNFIARGIGLLDFQGSVDDFTVHSSAFDGLTGLSIQALSPSITEKGDPVSFRITRQSLDNAPFPNPQVVSYSVGGSATPGADYITLSGSATIPANANSVDIVVTPVIDALVESTETITVTLNSSTDYGLTGTGSATLDLINSSDLSASLLAWYRFNESGGSIAADSSGNARDATLVGNPNWLPASQGLSFDGLNDDVQTSVSSGTARTLSAWIFPRSSDPTPFIESVFDTDVPGQYGTGWGLAGGKIRVILDDQFWDTDVAVTLNQWQHVSLSFDAVSARVYLNGVEAANLSYTQGWVDSANYRIGRSNANAEFFHGDIREAKIFDRAVFSAEAAEIYAGDPPAPTLSPRNLTAIADNSGVALHWQRADAGETGYSVRRSLVSGGPYTALASGITATSYRDNNLSNGTTYYYVVAATSDFGSGPVSNEASATPGGNAPPPQWVQANVGGAAGSPTTTFSDSRFSVNGAGTRISNGSNTATDSFRFVYIPLVGDSTVTARVLALGSTNAAAKAGVMIRESLAAGSRHASTLLSPATMALIRRANTDSNAASGTTANAISQPWLRIVRSGQTFASFYSADGSNWVQIDVDRVVAMSNSAVYYAGLAVCSGNATALSNAVFSEVSITGGHPTGVTATAGNASATIEWSPVAGAASYRVKRSQFSGGPYEIVGDEVTATTFNDAALVNGSTYHYVVSALNASLGQSLDSLQVSATPAPPRPPVPLNPAASPDHRRVFLTWDHVSTASGYLVRRATASGGPYTTVGSPGGSSFTDTGLSNGTSYYYVIVAYNSGGESPASTEVSATPSLFSNDGTWSSASGGDWDEPANWLASTIAVGTDRIASFPQGGGSVMQNIAGLTLGNLSFGGGSSTLAGSAITLDRSSGTPEIAVAAGASASIDLALNGSDGLVKTGDGTLVLQGASTPGGAATISAGNLTLRGGYAAGSMNVAAGALLQLDNVADRDFASITFTGAGTLRKSGTGRSYWGGNAATFALSGGSLIDVQEGVFTAGSNANENWTDNRSDLHVAFGAVFNTVEANVRIDRITGDGAIGTGYSGAGYQNLSIGIGDGSSRFDGVISNTDNNPSFVGSLVKLGSGTITLTNNCTYSGGTSIVAGTLELGDGTSGKDGRLANTNGVTNNGVLAFNIHGNQSVLHPISGSGSVRKDGQGELSFTSNHSYGGGTSIEQGRLILDGASGGNGRIRGSVVVRADAELRVSAGDGSGLGYNGGAKVDLLHLDGGLLNSPGVCHFWQAGLQMTGGEFRGNNAINDPGGPYFEWGNSSVTTFASPNASLISGRIRIRPDASPWLVMNVADGPVTNDLQVGAALTEASAGAGIQKHGAGTLALRGSNSYSGVTLIAGGVLNAADLGNYGQVGSLGNRASDSSGNVGLLFRGGTLQYTGASAQSTNRAIRVSTSGGAILDASGSNPSATVDFTATASPDFFENPGDRSLTFTGSNSGLNRFAMAIGEAGGMTRVTKTGSGTWVLAGSNSYSGPTEVNAGKLFVQGQQNSATGSITVAAAATLGGSGSVGGGILVQAGGTLAPGMTIGTFTAPAASIGGTLAIELDGSSADLLDVSGALDIASASLDLTGSITASELVIARFGSLSGSSFAAVSGLPAGYELDYDLVGKRIVLRAVAEDFAAWIDAFAVSDRGPEADPDHDGISNALEYVLGGDPAVSSRDGLPSISIVGDHLVFSFNRSDRSESADLSLFVEAGSDLATWPEVFTVAATGSQSSSGVGIQENGDAADLVVVSIPRGETALKFARLRVVIAP